MRPGGATSRGKPLPGAPAAEFRGVTKLFGPTTALADASFRLDPGLVHALLGPNGSGKTTAIDILTATRRADAGVASVFGHPVARGGASTSLVSLMPQAVDFPDYLTSREVLTLWLAHYPDALKVPDAITTFELNDIADRQTGGLSGGQAKRLALACAVASSTPLIVLDEPSASLDVYGQRFVTATIQRLRDSGTTVLLASHDMHEVERLADRILCLDSGRVLGQWSADDFRALAGYRSLFFRSTLPEHRVRLLCESAGMEAQRDVTVPGRWRIDTPRSDDAARRLLECAVNPGLTIREAGIGDVFERIVAMSGERER